MLLLTISCKNDVEDIIDCLFEPAYISVSTSVDEQNEKMVTFTVDYSGDYTLDTNITWDFGDGNVKTHNGTSITHTYSASGGYKVISKITLRNGDAYCTFDHSTNVSVK